MEGLEGEVAVEVSAVVVVVVVLRVAVEIVGVVLLVLVVVVFVGVVKGGFAVVVVDMVVVILVVVPTVVVWLCVGGPALPPSISASGVLVSTREAASVLVDEITLSSTLATPVFVSPTP